MLAISRGETRIPSKTTIFWRSPPPSLSLLHHPPSLPPSLYITASSGSQHLLSLLLACPPPPPNPPPPPPPPRTQVQQQHAQISADQPARLSTAVFPSSLRRVVHAGPCVLLPSGFFLAVNRYVLSLLFLPPFASLASASGSLSIHSPLASSRPALPLIIFLKIGISLHLLGAVAPLRAPLRAQRLPPCFYVRQF